MPKRDDEFDDDGVKAYIRQAEGREGNVETSISERPPEEA